jgi:hypothetical protein
VTILLTPQPGGGRPSPPATTTTIAINKCTLNQVLAKPSRSDLTPEEADLPLTQFDTLTYQEGYRAFLETRCPNFIGP